MKVAWLALLGTLGCTRGDAPKPMKKPVDTGSVVDTDLPTETVAAVVDAHGVQVCADPAAREGAPYRLQTVSTPATSLDWGWGAGLLAGDLDDDGELEVWIPSDAGIRTFEVEAGELVENLDLVLPPGLQMASGGALADYDGDGDLDVYLTRWIGSPGLEVVEVDGERVGYNRLLRNDGPDGFVDVTDLAGGVHACTEGTELDCHRSTSASWGDYDRDGDLDLYVGNHGFIDGSEDLPQTAHGPGEPDFLYRNDGDGTFTDISSELPRDHGYTFSGGFFDLDDDGWLDLYAVHDMGENEPNHVVWNHEGTWFADPDDASGLRVQMTGMGLGVGDLNADGRPDLAMAEWNGNVVLESRRDLGVWIDITASSGVTVDHDRNQRVAWGSELADLDNDGDLDLLVQYGFIYEWGNPRWDNPDRQRDALYVNEGTPEAASFVDRGDVVGIDQTEISRGVLVHDLDHDGWLDLIKRDLGGNNQVYLANCGPTPWLEVRLNQPDTANLNAVGAKVEVHAGGRIFTRTVVAGGTSLEVGGPPELHFGLGDGATIEALVVHWPDGEVTVLDGVDTSQRIDITRMDAR